FEGLLAEGSPRSLGRTEEVVLVVLRRPGRLDELFDCLFNDDEIVRMRAGDALEKVCRDRPDLFQSYIPRLFNEVSKIDQPSVQWHLAQMLAEVTLNVKERSDAVRLLKRNLSQSKDWIVITCTMDSLAHFAQDDVRLRRWFIDELREYQGSEYKSIATRARKLLAKLTVNPSL
ncbi:MAG: hypothetical protein ACREDR_39505, partial [Blastocatellia bacterium]